MYTAENQSFERTGIQADQIDPDFQGKAYRNSQTGTLAQSLAQMLESDEQVKATSTQYLYILPTGLGVRADGNP